MAYPITTTFCITVEIGLKSDIEKLKRLYLIDLKALYMALPDVYKSIKTNQNAENQQAADIEIEYAAGLPVDSKMESAIINVAEAKVSYAVVGGSYLEYYNSYEGTIQLVSTGCTRTGGTKAILTYKIETKKGSPDFQRFIDFDVSVLKRVDNLPTN